MALNQAMCTSFKQELLTATHNFTASTGNTFKIALFRATGSLVGSFGADTTNYGNMGADEASGPGYTAGGKTLTNVTPVTSGTTAFVDFADVTWSASSLTASGALLYNTSATNRSVAVLAFGGDKTTTAGDFTIIFPTPDASNAILRIA